MMYAEMYTRLCASNMGLSDQATELYHSFENYMGLLPREVNTDIGPALWRADAAFLTLLQCLQEVEQRDKPRLERYVSDHNLPHMDDPYM